MHTATVGVWLFSLVWLKHADNIHSIQYTLTCVHLFSFNLKSLNVQEIRFMKSMNQFRKMFVCKALVKEKCIVSPDVAVKVQVKELF